MLPRADLVVHVSVLVDDARRGGAVAVPPRPGRPPAGSAAEVRTRAIARRLRARPSARGFLAEGRRDWAAYCPRRPPQRACHRRRRWRWGAAEARRGHGAAAAPADPWRPADASARPVTPPSRVRGPGRWRGPGGPGAGAGFDAAPHASRVVLRVPAGRAPRPGRPPGAGLGARPGGGRRAGGGRRPARRGAPRRAAARPGLPGRGPGPGAPRAGPPDRHPPGPRRAPGAPRRPAPPRGPAAHPDRDAPRRADRAPGAGAPRGEDRLGAAPPRRRHQPGPHAAAPRPHLTDEGTADA